MTFTNPSGNEARRWPAWLILLPLLVIGLAFSPVLGPQLPACHFREATGFLCPGCGATRSAMALQDGRWSDALQNNVVFASSVLGGGLWLFLAGLRERFPEVPVLRLFRFRLWFLWFALAALLVFWVTRNLPGFGFLRPV